MLYPTYESNLKTNIGDCAMKNFILSGTITLAMVFAAGTALAGGLDAPAPPTAPGSAMYTGGDIYNRLTTGAAGVKRSGPFAEPAAGPAAAGRTLNEIMAAAPAADNTNGAKVTDVLSGKTFWGLRTDGTWGHKTGTVAPGSNVTGGNGLRTFPIPNGLYSGGKTATAGDTSLVTGNIRSGAAIFGVNGSVIQATGNAAAGDVLSGKSFSNAAGAGAGSMPNNGAVTITPGTKSKAIPAGYHNGNGTVAGDASLVTGNIKKGVSIFGVNGSPAVVDTSSGTAAAGDLASGKTAYVNGNLVTGTFVPVLAKRVVNKTGYMQCWDSSGTLLSSCSGTGQDGEYQYGNDPAIAPTSGATGAYNTPALVSGTRFTDNGDGTVTDNLTALIWLKNANCTDTVGGIPGPGVSPLNWDNALIWSNYLASSYCGLSDGSKPRDWRLPNINELHSLGPNWPPGTPFTGVQYWYWSSSTDPGSAGAAWGVAMSDGLLGDGNKTFNLYVWPVRGGQ
jgi:hypothetical protein